MTLVTRATAPIVESGMLANGAHVNAVGAISPERTEFEPDVLSRCAAVVADSVPQVKNLSSEFMQILSAGRMRWRAVRPLSDLVAEERPAVRRRSDAVQGHGHGYFGPRARHRNPAPGAEQRRGREFPHPKPANLRLKRIPNETSHA